MEKIGMRREACFVKAQRGGSALGGEWCDRYQYAILAEEYFATPKCHSGTAKTEVSIVPYEPKYRGDMLFCYLAAKDAIGKYTPGQWSGPSLKEDLLDIEANYLGRGEVFYLALDERGRVAGMVGTQTTSPADLWLKRLFVKPELKGRGIGGKLLKTIEEYAIGKGVTALHTSFAEWYREAAFFYPTKGFAEAEPDGHMRHMVKRLKLDR